MKKLKIFLLTLLMVITVLPVNTIAEGEQTTAPDVTVYATKDDMMGETFAPNSNGTAKNIGKILFGKNSSGNSQEWYILGADSGVNDGKNNTIIFATSPIVATGQVFEDAPNNKTDSSLWSDCDYNGVNVTEVYRNHYGASDLRVALQNMAANTSYFTTAEQGLMNPTTVTTEDKKNKDDSKKYLTMEIEKKAIGMTLIIIALLFFESPLAIAGAIVVTQIISLIIQSEPVEKIIGYSILAQLKDVADPLLQSIGMIFPVPVIKGLGTNVWFKLFAEIIGGALCYVILSILTKNQEFYSLKKLIVSACRKTEKDA